MNMSMKEPHRRAHIRAGLDSSDCREIGLLAVVLSKNMLRISFYSTATTTVH